MHPVNSWHALTHAPELREPNAERIGAEPEVHAAAFREKLHRGATFAEVRLTSFRNHFSDPGMALLLVASDGQIFLVLNELGPDTYGEMAGAGRALAKVYGVPFIEAPPEHWPVEKVSFLARLFGYAG